MGGRGELFFEVGEGGEALGEEGLVGEEDGDVVFDGVFEAADGADEEVAFVAEFAFGDGADEAFEQGMVHWAPFEFGGLERGSGFKCEHGVSEEQDDDVALSGGHVGVVVQVVARVEELLGGEAGVVEECEGGEGPGFVGGVVGLGVGDMIGNEAAHGGDFFGVVESEGEIGGGVEGGEFIVNEAVEEGVGGEGMEVAVGVLVSEGVMPEAFDLGAVGTVAALFGEEELPGAPEGGVGGEVGLFG